jgi:hypothetical protein
MCRRVGGITGTHAQQGLTGVPFRFACQFEMLTCSAAVAEAQGAPLAGRASGLHSAPGNTKQGSKLWTSIPPLSLQPPKVTGGTSEGRKTCSGVLALPTCYPSFRT